MNESVRIGVIGVGHLGRLHTMQLKQIPEARFTGIYDSDPQRLAGIAGEFEVPAFERIEDLIEQSDALSIVTPTTHHFEIARMALAAGRHVFIEKPFTTTLAEADQLLALSKEKDLKIQIGHIERFNPAIMSLEHLRINPLFIEAHRMANFNPRGTDVAVVMDLMIHDIDLILSFVKSPVLEVHASGMSVISATEDMANCRILFENGCVANVTASRISARNMRKMRFFQPNAYISVDFLDGISEVYHIDIPGLDSSRENLAFSLGEIERGAEKKEIRYSRMEKADINPLRHELQQFCQAILHDRTPPVTGEDGRRALAVAGLILEKINAHTRLVRQHWPI
ncbi:MAG: Gfo/Idh/MocA family oxidoreductase [Calditrichaeota bacterium]|nr:Gfo/Idh/MocA family oxidoreductase [Calditrichota bacterium]HQU70682.1 Gfo/Idh/MocA family oxidoreductase [Calditrichia bacterium]